MALAWQSAGIGPREYMYWARAGITDSAVAAQWRQAGISAETAGQWRQTGIRDLALILRLQRNKLRVSFIRECMSSNRWTELIAWLDDAESEASTQTQNMELWVLHGVTPAKARDWIDLDVKPSEFRIFTDHQVTPTMIHQIGCAKDEISVLAKVLALVGNWKPITELLSRGITIADIQLIVVASGTANRVLEWISIGVIEVGDILDYERKKISPKSLENFSHDPEGRKSFVEACDANPVSIEMWSSVGVLNGESVRLAKQHGIMPDDFSNWSKFGFEDVGTIAEWRSAIGIPAVAKSWRDLDIGVELAVSLGAVITSVDCQHLLSVGFSLQEILLVVQSKPSDVAKKRKFLLGHLCQFQTDWRKLQIAPEDWFGWSCETDDQISLVQLWISHQISLQQFLDAQRVSRYRLKAEHAQIWIAEGRRVDEEFEKVVSKSYLWTSSNHVPTNKSYADFSFLARRYPVDSNDAEHGSMRHVHETYERWIETMSTRATDDWLSSIRDLCDFLLPSVRKDISVGQLFEHESQGWNLEVIGLGREIEVLLTDMSGDRELIRFDPISLEPSISTDTPRLRLVFGLGVMWFLDWSVVFRDDISSASGHFSRRVDSSRTQSSASVRYVPTRSFSLASSVRLTTHASPIEHLVVGHIRTLPGYMQPSVEARSNAPAHIRRRMGENDTYVRPHSRGTEAGQVEVRNYLSQTSALGRALRTL